MRNEKDDINQYGKKVSGAVSIPEGVTIIKYCIFLYCTSLRSIDIPSSVTYIDDGAFFGCTELGSIFLPDKENLSIHNKAIPNTASKVRYSLDEIKGDVIITKIDLGTDKNSVEIPATICGNPVVAVASDYQKDVGKHTCILDYIPKKAATFTETGNIEYWHCKVCGNYFSDENGNTEINQQDTVIPKLIYYDPTEDHTIPVTGIDATADKTTLTKKVQRMKLWNLNQLYVSF